MALLAAEQFARAIPVYQKLLEITPNDRTAWYNLALAWTREGDLYQAEQTYRELLRRHGDFTNARSNLATLYQSQGKLQAAREQWRKVIAQAPRRADAHAMLGEVLIDLKDYDGAMRVLNEGANLSPKSVRAWLNLSTAAEKAGKGGRALYALEQAITLAPEDAEVWAWLGDVRLTIYRANEKADHLHQAILAWEKSLQLDPAQPELGKKLQQYKIVAKMLTDGAPSGKP